MYAKSLVPYQKLGDRITQLRRAKKMPVKTLAERCGVSRFTIYRIEYGKVRSQLRIVCAISRALGVPIDELL